VERAARAPLRPALRNALTVRHIADRPGWNVGSSRAGRNGGRYREMECRQSFGMEYSL